MRIAGRRPRPEPRRFLDDAPIGADGEGETLAESARVEAFSDGVFAIVITLLVLQLQAPLGPGTTLPGLLRQWPAYIAYLASFIYTGVTWVNHHQLFTRIRNVDTGLLWRNLVLLLTASVIPFPTAVLGNSFQEGSRTDQVAALVFYAVLAGLAAASWLLVFSYLSRTPRLLTPGTTADFFSLEKRRPWLGMGVCLLTAIAAPFSPVAGLVLAGAMPVFYGLTSRGLRRSATPRGSAARLPSPRGAENVQRRRR